MRHVVTLWVTRKSIDAGYHPPELTAAWDEFSIDENPEGWQEACRASLAALGNDLAQFRYITLRVHDQVLDRAFFDEIVEDADAFETELGPRTEPEARSANE